eukprot:2482245-Rhodomonas_salina.1
MSGNVPVLLKHQRHEHVKRDRHKTQDGWHHTMPPPMSLRGAIRQLQRKVTVDAITGITAALNGDFCMGGEGQAHLSWRESMLHVHHTLSFPLHHH